MALTADVPYKVQRDGSIEAIMQGARVPFRHWINQELSVGGPLGNRAQAPDEIGSALKEKGWGIAVFSDN